MCANERCRTRGALMRGASPPCAAPAFPLRGLKPRRGNAGGQFDDRHRWWRDGEITALADDQVEVTVLNGDHPRHPWQAETISVPRDPELVQRA